MKRKGLLVVFILFFAVSCGGGGEGSIEGSGEGGGEGGGGPSPIVRRGESATGCTGVSHRTPACFPTVKEEQRCQFNLGTGETICPPPPPPSPPCVRTPTRWAFWVREKSRCLDRVIHIKWHCEDGATGVLNTLRQTGQPPDYVRVGCLNTESISRATCFVEPGTIAEIIEWVPPGGGYRCKLTERERF